MRIITLPFTKGSDMRIRVECHSGYKANERPLRFFLGERKVEVRELLDRWYGEDYEYFKLLADDGNTYIFKYRRAQDSWELVEFSIPNLPTRGPHSKTCSRSFPC